jgi:hypothetical protein
MRLNIHAVCSLFVRKKHNTVVLKKQGEKGLKKYTVPKRYFTHPAIRCGAVRCLPPSKVGTGSLRFPQFVFLHC